MGALLSACRHERANGGSASQSVSEWAAPAGSNSFYFPVKKHPVGTASHEQALDPFMDSFYSSVLFCLHEPVLSSFCGPEEAYRFTLIPALFNHPISITISRRTDGYRLRVKAYRHPVTGRPGPTVLDTSIVLGPAEWNGLQEDLSKTGFWGLAAETNDVGDDGSDWILEGTRAGAYHFAVRWTPCQGRYQEFHDCCNYLYSLAKKAAKRDDYLPFAL